MVTVYKYKGNYYKFTADNGMARDASNIEQLMEYYQKQDPQDPDYEEDFIEFCKQFSGNIYEVDIVELIV